MKNYDPAQICVVADSKLLSLLPETEYPVLGIDIREADKSLETVARIWDFLFEHDITRSGLLICIGGGALTDMGGFAAATYKRGIDYINIPTTLLAMIDASVGGKTGVNYNGLKNSIGAFYPPVGTLLCPDWLKTLPSEQLLSGFAEMLKTGLLSGSALFTRLLQYDLAAMDTDALMPLVTDCIRVKRRIVEADPQEKGQRKALNLGHTVGHALEEVSITSGGPALPHGYAVLYGLITELYLSAVKFGCPREPLQQLTDLMIHYYGRIQCKCSDRDRLLELMRQDKKNEHATDINCTLLGDVGQPLVNQLISPDEMNEALDYLFSL